MNNKPEAERVYKFHVHFEPISISRLDMKFEDIRNIEVDVYARTIDEALSTAWKTVTVGPENFRIVEAVEEGLFTKAYNRFLNE